MKKQENIIGDNIKKILLERGIEQKWLAARAGTTPATISRTINGQSMVVAETVGKIALALDVSTDYLLGLTPIPDSKTEKNQEYAILRKCFMQTTQKEQDTIWAILSDYMSESEYATICRYKNQREKKSS